MSLKKALVWWNDKGGIHDHDDIMFVAGYQKAIEDAIELISPDDSVFMIVKNIRCMDDLDMPRVTRCG